MSNTISKAIRIAMVKGNLSQKDLCHYFGYSKSYVSEICTGKKELKPSQLESLSLDLFHIPLSELIELGEL